MKRWIGWAVTALVLAFVAMGVLETMGDLPEVDALAAQTCREVGACTGEPSEFSTDPLRREYTWDTPTGLVIVTCRRAYLLTGDFSCSLFQRGADAPDPGKRKQDPHEIPRGFK